MNTFQCVSCQQYFATAATLAKHRDLLHPSSPTEEAGEHQTIHENEPRQGKYIFVSFDSIK